MRDSVKRDLMKPLELLAQLLVFETGFCIVKEGILGDGITAAKLVEYCTPSYWFVFVYIALYLVSPYINLVWAKLDGSGKKTLLAVMLGLFSVYPLIIEICKYHNAENSSFLLGTSTVGLEGAQAGYTIVNFVLMYLIGCLLRDREEQIAGLSAGKLILLLLLNIGAIFAWARIEQAISGRPILATTAINYENPLVITEAVLFFLLFRRLDLGSSKIINGLAAASFPSYLIHMNLLEYFGIEQAVKGNPALLALHIVGVTAAVYLISFVICTVYQQTFGRLLRMLSGHWKNHRFISV